MEMEFMMHFDWWETTQFLNLETFIILLVGFKPLNIDHPQVLGAVGFMF